MDIVDQYYWLGYAKQEVDNTATRLNDAASKISSLVAVFWGLYTAVFTIGASIKKLDESPIILFLLILPIPLLICSYMFALWAQMPQLSLTGIDPRVPDEVMGFYNTSIRNKKIRVWLSLTVFFVSGIALTFALVYANFTHQKSDKQQLIISNFNGANLMISGDLPNKTLIHYIVKDKYILSSDSTIVLQDNHFDKTVKNVINKTGVLLVVNWVDPSDTSIKHGFSKYYPAPKAKDKEKKEKASDK